MLVADIAVTMLAATVVVVAALMNFTGHPSVKAVAAVVHVPPALMVPFGLLQALGSFGLLIGYAVPAVGTVAAAGLVVFFLAAVAAHLRVGDFDRGRLGTASAFLTVAIAALFVALHR